MPTTTEMEKAFELLGQDQQPSGIGSAIWSGLGTGVSTLLDALRATALVPMSAYSGLMGGLVGLHEGTPFQSALKAASQTARGLSFGSEDPIYGYADYLADMNMGEGPIQETLGTVVDLTTGMITDPLAIAGSLRKAGVLGKALAKVMGKGPTSGRPNYPSTIDLRPGFFDKANPDLQGMRAASATSSETPPFRQLTQGAFEMPPAPLGLQRAIGKGQQFLGSGSRQIPEGLLFPEVMPEKPIRGMLSAGTIPGTLSESTKRLYESFGAGVGPKVEDLVQAFESIGLRKDLQKAARKTLGKKKSPSETDSNYVNWFKQRIFDAKSEAKGTEILDTLDSKNILPGDVQEKFWKDTYWKLNGGQQSYFKKYAKNLYNESDPTEIAKFAQQEAPLKHSQLEGSERGFWAMMDEANRLTGKTKKSPVDFSTLTDASNLPPSKYGPTPKISRGDKSIPTLVLEDGEIAYGKAGQQHFEINLEKKIPFDLVKERGFVSDIGYTNPGNVKGFTKKEDFLKGHREGNVKQNVMNQEYLNDIMGNYSPTVTQKLQQYFAVKNLKTGKVIVDKSVGSHGALIEKHKLQGLVSEEKLDSGWKVGDKFYHTVREAKDAIARFEAKGKTK
jgi:hypothetical protein